MKPISYSRHRFPPDIIRHGVVTLTAETSIHRVCSTRRARLGVQKRRKINGTLRASPRSTWPAKLKLTTPADGGRRAPSALDAQEIEVYVALPSGAYLYDASENALRLVAASDVRRVTRYQDFVDEAPLDLVFVADYSRVKLVPVAQRESYASAAAGAICQNVYLFAASNELSAVTRAWIDRGAVADALGLSHDQQVLLSQTVGFPGT